ncbi:hypothetical protein SDC9_161309 [bioreactor metagenome]|uniref:Uncharacterized protein n=1 Tax=bioreactor metagenome TaxID=1076179 RepID=A0A645FP65_9ZZZZ
MVGEVGAADNMQIFPEILRNGHQGADDVFQNIFVVDQNSGGTFVFGQRHENGGQVESVFQFFLRRSVNQHRLRFAAECGCTLCKETAYRLLSHHQ